MTKRITIAGGVIIVLLVVVLLSMDSQGNKSEPKPVLLNQEFELRKGEEAIFNGIQLVFEGYEMKSGRGGEEGIAAKFKASLEGGETSWFEISEARGTGWDVLIENRVGSGDNTDPSKELHHVFVVKFVKKVSDDVVRASIVSFETLHGRDAYEKWYKEAIHPEQ